MSVNLAKNGDSFYCRPDRKGTLLFLVSQRLDLEISPYPRSMKSSTQKFIELMRQRYGPAESVGRGNIINFGGQVNFAIRNSVFHPNGAFFAIQNDFLEGRFTKYATPTLGNYAALICDDENTVVVIPQQVVVEQMKDSPSDRVHVVRRGTSFFLRVTGKPLLDVTEYKNKFPSVDPHVDFLADQNTVIIENAEEHQVEIRDHTRIQWMLIQFGRAAGYTTWVPNGDRAKEYNGEIFSTLVLPQLPNFGFDSITNQIISNIDVLWLEGNVIHKAFEIESTTSIYSGLLRMSDLVLSQPNITIDLNVVAPLKRRELVRKNILRPSFTRLRPKCSYISFEEITGKFEIVKTILRRQHAKIQDLLESEKF